MNGNLGPSVLPHLARAEVRSDECRPARDTSPVAETEIKREARDDDQIGLLERSASLVAKLNVAVPAQQASRHASEPSRDPQGLHGVCDRGSVAAVDQRLTADDQRRPLGGAQERSDLGDVGALGARLGGEGFANWRDDTHMGLVELPVQMATHVELERLGAEVLAILDAALLHEHLADHLLGIEDVDRHLDEDRPRNPVLGEIKGLLYRRPNAVDLLDRDRPFGDRLHQRNLVDVLQRAAAFE